MKKFGFQLGFVLVILSLFTVACDNYEDGPKISLRSKRERVINTWRAEYAYRDDVDATAWYKDWTLDLREDGRLIITDLDENDSVVTQHGFWDLVNDDEDIRFLYSVPAVDPDQKTVTILRLMEKQLWFRDVTDTATWEFQLIPADTAS